MALTEIPTKTEDSIGIEKSDNLPEGVVLDTRHWTTAAQLERMKDTLIDLSTDVGEDDSPAAESLKARVTALEATSGGGAESSVVWQWNETDVSQFRISFDEIASGATALSVQQAVWGPVLRVTFPTKVTGAKIAFFTINAPGMTKDALDRYRYELRFRLVGFSGTATEWYALGPAFLCNQLTGASFYGLASLADANNAGRIAKVEAGAAALSAATPNWSQDILTAGSSGFQVLFSHTVVAKHAAASAPGFLNTARAEKMGTGTAVTIQDSAGSAYFISNISAFSAGWNSETLDSCGIAILGTTGTATGYFEFDQIQILKHPMDQ